MSTGCLILLSAVCLQQVSSKTPTAADLMKLAPDIKSTDGKYRTIRVEGHLKHPGSLYLRYQAIYRAPDDFSIVMSDGTDGTPVVYSTNKQVIFYDPIRPTVIYSKSLNTYLSFGAKGDKMSLGAGVETNKPEFGSIHLDLKSLSESMNTGEERVVDSGDRTYRLSQVSALGDTLVCSFDLKQPCPLTSIKVYPKGSHDSTMGLDRIIVDGSVGDDDFRFPDMERLARLVPVRDDSDAGVLRAVGDFAEVMKSFRARAEAHHPAQRPSGLRAAIRRGDWDRVKANDQKFAEAIKATLRTVPDRPSSGERPRGPANLDQRVR